MTDVVLTGLAKQLVLAELLNEKTAQQAYAQARRNKLSLVTYLVQNRLVKSLVLAEMASDQFGVPFLDLNTLDKDGQPKGLVSENWFGNNNVLPCGRGVKSWLGGVSARLNHRASMDIQFSTGLNTEAILVEDDKLSDAIEKFFDTNSGLGEMADVDLGLEIETVDDSKETTLSGQSDADDAPVVRFVNKMLLDAIRLGSSDLHFEPYEKTFRVRLRTDGILHEVAKPPIHLASRIAARLKVMASLDISERRKPQDGRIKLRISKTKAIDFRVNTLPTLWGEKIVMRILDPTSAQMGIDALGYEPEQKELYLEALRQPQGMILVTGPTGSGKTVSLYTGLNILNTVDINISTAEDPVEINLEGINQVNVNPRQGMDFSQALRSFLRQDPDVIMVGEIRDLETAEIAIKAAQTGHMVLSTLHTNSAPETLTRMVDMGVKPYAIATSVSLIIAQRLARRLHDCKKPMPPLPAAALLAEGFSQAEIDGGLQLFDAAGCSGCNEGYKGRTGIYQVMPITEAIAKIILAGGNAIQIAQAARESGIKDLRASALLKAKNGVTSLAEINRVTKD